MTDRFNNIMTDNFLSIIHLRTFQEGVFNAGVTFLAFIFGYYEGLVLDNVDLFMAVTTVVIADWVFGTVLAIKANIWETQKALKIIYYLISYNFILSTILSIEKGHPSAFWLSEAIIMPILIFQTISIIKNMSLIGLIPKGLLTEILDKIDGYKNKRVEEKTGENEIEIKTEENE